MASYLAYEIRVRCKYTSFFYNAKYLNKKIT